MADNTTLNPGAAGDPIVTREISHAGDTAKLQGVFAMGITGSEGSYTAEAVGGDATNGLDVDVTRVSGNVAVTNAGLTELAAAINGSSQMDVNIAASNATITVASHAVTNAGTFAVQNTAATPAGTNNIGDVDVLTIAAGDNNIGNVDIVTVPADPFGANADAASATGSISAKLRFIAATGIPITGTVTVGSHAVTNAGTFAVQAVAAGAAADDVAVSGNPVLNAGSSVQTDGTDPGAVSAESEVATLRTDMQRNLLVNITHPRLFRASADYGSAQTNTTVQAAPGASLSLYITDVIISNGATAGNITLLDGSGGTVLLEIYPAINGGMAHSFRNPLRLTANTLLAITSTTVTTHAVTVTGYIAP